MFHLLYSWHNCPHTGQPQHLLRCKCCQQLFLQRNFSLEQVFLIPSYLHFQSYLIYYKFSITVSVMPMPVTLPLTGNNAFLIPCCNLQICLYQGLMGFPETVIISGRNALSVKSNQNLLSSALAKMESSPVFKYCCTCFE